MIMEPQQSDLWDYWRQDSEEGVSLANNLVMDGREPTRQWFSTFLRPRPFNTVPHAVKTLNHKIIPSLLHNCHSATIMDYNVNICYAGYPAWDPQVKNHCTKVLHSGLFQPNSWGQFSTGGKQQPLRWSELHCQKQHARSHHQAPQSGHAQQLQCCNKSGASVVQAASLWCG